MPGQFPGLLFPEDGWGHPIGVDWHSEQDRASHLWALLWNQDQHPQHQKSSAGWVLHAGMWKVNVNINEICLQRFNWFQVYSVFPVRRLPETWTDLETTSFSHTSTWPRFTRSPATGLSHTSWGCQNGLFSTTTPSQRTTAWEQSLKFPLKCKSTHSDMSTSWLEFGSNGLCVHAPHWWDKHVLIVFVVTIKLGHLYTF